MSASKLDTEKLRKVRGLIDGGATAGERDAARSRATAIAAKAGMTLEQALSKLDIAEKPATGPKVQTWEEYWEERQPERDARWEAAIKKHGPAEPVFAETEIETKLRIVLEPFATYRKYDNVDKLYVDGYIGYGGSSNNPDGFARMMEKLVPLPKTLPDLMAEWQVWDALIDLRCEYDRDYEFPVHLRARRDVLEHLIDRIPARCWDDLYLRISWRERCAEVDRWSSIDDDLAIFQRLRDDIDYLRGLNTPASPAETENVQFGHRTTADKRRAVLSILDDYPDLTDREIARRAGVSPQTVNNWRNKIKGRNAA